MMYLLNKWKVVGEILMAHVTFCCNSMGPRHSAGDVQGDSGG